MALASPHLKRFKKDRMQDKLNIAVFVDYDNIEIGLKSTLRREFDVSLALDALKERGDIVAKFAYANWGRQDGATRQMAENAVQMVQRIPSPRGDKNGADINLALDRSEEHTSELQSHNAISSASSARLMSAPFLSPRGEGIRCTICTAFSAIWRVAPSWRPQLA